MNNPPCAKDSFPALEGPIAFGNDWMRGAKRAMCVSTRERSEWRMQRRLSEAQSEKLAQDLAQLPHLSGDRLNDHLLRLYGVAPPARLRRPLLIRAIAYQLREKALGGLKPATRRLLASVADASTARRTVQVPAERKIKRSAGSERLLFILRSREYCSLMDPRPLKKGD